MESLAQGAIRFRHLGDLRDHGAFPVRFAGLQLFDALLPRGAFLVRESLGFGLAGHATASGRRFMTVAARPMSLRGVDAPAQASTGKSASLGTLGRLHWLVGQAGLVYRKVFRELN